MKRLFTFLFLFNIAFAQCPPNTWSLNVTINPDQYPQETSWYIMTFFGDTLLEGGPYTNIIDYEPQYQRHLEIFFKELLFEANILNQI